MKIPKVLENFLINMLYKRQAREVWDWLQSNSNTVIVDELEIAIKKRKDWKGEEV